MRPCLRLAPLLVLVGFLSGIAFSVVNTVLCAWLWTEGFGFVLTGVALMGVFITPFVGALTAFAICVAVCGLRPSTVAQATFVAIALSLLPVAAINLSIAVPYGLFGILFWAPVTTIPTVGQILTSLWVGHRAFLLRPQPSRHPAA